LAVAALVSACATSGQENDASAPAASESEESGRLGQVRDGIGDAATVPLRDVGLIRPDIPTPLANLKYPYHSISVLSGCPQVLYEIGQLDAALGVESYQPGARRSLSDRAGDAAASGTVGLAKDAAGDAIPFRGWVRRASGAEKAERKLAQAIEMGQTRRAFLRGYGAALGCTNVVPAPPPRERVAIDPRTPPPQGRDQKGPRG
jgi:hypothetical protein